MSHVYPPAQSVESAHVVLHAPNALSHAYSRQSKPVPPPVGQPDPSDVQTLGPLPVDWPVHEETAQVVPALAAVQAPFPSHVETQLAPPPQLLRGSTPSGTSAHLPGDVGSAHE